MQTKTLIITILIALTMLSFAGCFSAEEYRPSGWQTNTASREGRYAGRDNQPTAVESAIELSDKYATLSQEAATLRRQNETLAAENQKLKEELLACRGELEKTKKELAESSDLITEMRVELNNWKESVLGFRGEMRDAQKAQLEALLKILKLLGAEPAAAQPAGDAPQEEHE